MANKQLFSSSPAFPANTRNEAGGDAHAFSPAHALAQYASTGTFNHTFYATAAEQLDRVLELCRAVSPELVAKVAVYARERGRMKDMPALLLAFLSTVDAKLFAAVFPRVVDDGKMLRTFAQIVRSGVVGRKSFGSAPKRMMRRWFAARSPEEIFRHSLGSQPSMKDVIKMVRPSPRAGGGGASRDALYRYLLGKDAPFEALPPAVQTFESFKRRGGELPDVPFELLTSTGLGRAEWSKLALRMSYNQLRMNLNTLLRHGVFEDPGLVAELAARLSDEARIRKARVLPYQLLAAARAGDSNLPAPIRLALERAVEVAIRNVPAVNGKIYVCPDVSGSMRSPVTGTRQGASSSVRCIDVAALVAATLLRQNPTAEVLPFSDDVVELPRPLDANDSVLENAKRLAELPSGGTACSAPLLQLNRRRASGDLVIYVSDNQSWSDFAQQRSGTAKWNSWWSPTVMAEEWQRFRRRNPAAKLVLIDLQPYGTTQVAERSDVLNVGGFSDAVFEIVSLFANGELGADHWLSEVLRVSIA